MTENAFICAALRSLLQGEGRSQKKRQLKKLPKSVVGKWVFGEFEVERAFQSRFS